MFRLALRARTTYVRRCLRFDFSFVTPRGCWFCSARTAKLFISNLISFGRALRRFRLSFSLASQAIISYIRTMKTITVRNWITMSTVGALSAARHSSVSFCFCGGFSPHRVIRLVPHEDNRVSREYRTSSKSSKLPFFALVGRYLAGGLSSWNSRRNTQPHDIGFTGWLSLR